MSNNKFTDKIINEIKSKINLNKNLIICKADKKQGMSEYSILFPHTIKNKFKMKKRKLKEK